MEMTISFGDQTLVYRKKTWKIPRMTAPFDERGVRYGENPDQEAALYELVNGNLLLGDCSFIEPGNGLVSRHHGGGHAAGRQTSGKDQPDRYRQRPQYPQIPDGSNRRRSSSSTTTPAAPPMARAWPMPTTGPTAATASPPLVGLWS